MLQTAISRHPNGYTQEKVQTFQQGNKRFQYKSMISQNMNSFIFLMSFHFFKFRALINKNNRFNSHLQSKTSFPSLIIYDRAYCSLGLSSTKLCLLNDETSKVDDHSGKFKKVATSIM